ncbi:MAG: MBL fold metallo-hydrolase, partial [Gammaproteobacteria bacterium]|nr:MBL fold metallo-hydrolase [Gammaproteobacteria bacterium]
MPSPKNSFNTFIIIGILITGMIGMTTLTAQVPPTPGRDDPVRQQAIDPFHIIDNIYFIGKTSHNPSYLFTSDEGHIIMDSTYEEFVPDIEANVRKLGFNIQDVKIILSSHAHHD